jgi:dephospho-CoA kinase
VTRPVAVAITGGIGAGKSEALLAFGRHGAATVSSDEIVHHLLRRDDVRAAVVARMGNGIVAPDGEIDRGALATVVCVTEVPLLYETGGDARFDKVVVITAPEKLRRMRSGTATDDRESRLIPDREKAERADYVFRNLGSLDELDAFVAGVMDDLAAR